MNKEGTMKKSRKKLKIRFPVLGNIVSISKTLSLSHQ
jgi:hypothetical protein